MVRELSRICATDTGSFSCDRRTLLAGSGGALLLAAVPESMSPASAGLAQSARLSFFDDRPMIDRSGQLPAYQPPQGHRGTGPLASADERRLRYLMPFIT
jgi:hypothetical protein